MKESVIMIDESFGPWVSPGAYLDSLINIRLIALHTPVKVKVLFNNLYLRTLYLCCFNFLYETF